MQGTLPSFVVSYLLFQIEGSILRIPNVQVIDRGVYVCDVQSSGGRSRETSILEVESRSLFTIYI